MWVVEVCPFVRLLICSLPNDDDDDNVDNKNNNKAADDDAV